MKRSLFVFGILLVIAMTLLSGIIQGRITNRWGVPRDLLTAAEKLQQIPHRFGSWQLESSEKLPQSVVEMLQCTGYAFGTYVNQETGESVRLLVLLGPSGPMSSHTPEICFSSRNFAINEQRQRASIETGGSSANFWALTFQSNDLNGERLRVYYGWNAANRWSAPDEPRLTFARYSFIYKIQLASTLTPTADPQHDDSCRRFLKDFVPAVQSFLPKAT